MLGRAVTGAPKAVLAPSRAGSWAGGCDGTSTGVNREALWAGSRAGTVPTPVMSCQVSAPGIPGPLHPHNTALPTSFYPDTSFPLPGPTCCSACIPFSFRSEDTHSRVPIGTVPVPSEPPRQRRRLGAIGSLLAHSGKGILIWIFHNCVPLPGPEVPLSSPPTPGRAHGGLTAWTGLFTCSGVALAILRCQLFRKRALRDLPASPSPFCLLS